MYVTWHLAKLAEHHFFDTSDFTYTTIFWDEPLISMSFYLIKLVLSYLSFYSDCIILRTFNDFTKQKVNVHYSLLKKPKKVQLKDYV